MGGAGGRGWDSIAVNEVECVLQRNESEIGNKRYDSATVPVNSDGRVESSIRLL